MSQSLTPRLEIQQKTTVKTSTAIAQKAQASLKILAMSRPDLEERISAEMEQNPFLEVVQDGADAQDWEELAQAESVSEQDVTSGAETYDRSDAWSLESDSHDTTGVEDGAVREVGDTSAHTAEPTDSSSMWDGVSSASGRQQADPYTERGSGEDLWEQPPASLYQHIESQLGILVSAQERALATTLLMELDEKGRITQTDAEIAQRLGVTPERIGLLIAKLQQAEPTGVFSRNLVECLSLQLQELGELDAPMRALLDHLDKLAAGNFDALQEACQCSRQELLDMLSILRSLEHDPCQNFAQVEVQTLIPDVFVRARQDGTLMVEVNERLYPRLAAKRDYFQWVVSHRAVASDVHKCQELKQKFDSAVELVSSIERRGKTLMTVMAAIAELQKEFFHYGIDHLRPLVLNDIAVAVGLAESTVSRTCAHKYVATPRGTFELKFFFGSSVQNARGEATVAANTVKHRIKVLIGEESKSKPLSDHYLQALLAQEGIHLARRTVTKYREALHLPSSVDRKRKYQREAALSGSISA